jgi:hypothetical protein
MHLSKDCQNSHKYQYNQDQNIEKKIIQRDILNREFFLKF